MKYGLFYCCLWAVLFDVWFHAKQRIAVLVFFANELLFVGLY